MIAVAKCRLGVICRYHGKAVPSPSLIKNLHGKAFFPVCPEMEAGLPVPRPPIKRRHGKLYLANKDITNLLETFSQVRVKELRDLGVNLFIGVKGSPCCDPFSGLFARNLKGEGIKVRLSL